jgi:hypothetical protein
MITAIVRLTSAVGCKRRAAEDDDDAAASRRATDDGDDNPMIDDIEVISIFDAVKPQTWAKILQRINNNRIKK